MLTRQEARQAHDGGGDVVGPDGRRIGMIGQIFLDDESGQPGWVTVRASVFGTAMAFVSLDEATLAGDDVVVAFDGVTVMSAPRVEAIGGHLSEADQTRLTDYYAGTTR